MIELLGQPLTAALSGGLGGVLLGLASSHRMRMWGLAIGVAIVGSFTLGGFGLINIDRAFHLTIAFSWAPAIFGGLIFGYGMALAGTCGFGALARLGGGDLRAFVIVLVMGLAAFAVLSGPLAPARVSLPPSDERRPARWHRPCAFCAHRRIGGNNWDGSRVGDLCLHAERPRLSP